MKIRKAINLCTISLLSLITLSGVSYNPAQVNVSARHIRYARRYHHSSWWCYRTIFHYTNLQYDYPSHYHRILVNNAFKRYNKHLSSSQLLRLQRRSGVYRTLYHKNKKYFYHVLKRIIINQIRRKFYRRHANSLASVNKPQNKQSKFDSQLRIDTIRDINQTRRRHHVRPLKVINIVQKAADYRSPKVLFAYEHPLDCLKYENISMDKLKGLGGSTDGWIHGTDTHTSGYDYLTRHHHSPNEWGANATNWFLDTDCVQSDGASEEYPDTTPWNIAYNINDDFMNHDMSNGNNNGHRKNELNRDYKYIGVGVNYDGKKKVGTVNIQFAS